ncbi:MAG: glycine cleavage system protein GcvH [Chloroflexi bacterium]|nr:MAG: glycine cleavage system protein GcvH [Chloroflexota bacterium]MBL1195833.1 glycine cleavage system protein GcvH [Chloroflexota bacterium]NOH13125.1 glycine cleavage system protein GcvH [Chloroflexota bacterium]
MDFPADIKYTPNDEWIRVEGNIGTVGITDWAQDQLSDIVYLEVSLSEGDDAAKGDSFGTIESVKAASDVYLPVAGKVTEINEALQDAPEVINSDPYGAGWVVKIEIADAAEVEALLDSAAYEAKTQEADA